MRMIVNRAADILLGGGVIAYPTEGVFGIGCLPDIPTALQRILTIKRRDPAKGLILIAATKDQFSGWVANDDLHKLPPPDAAHPITWIVQPATTLSPLLTGAHSGLAVRLCTHPIAAAICNEVQSPITSTSANVSDGPSVRNKIQLRRRFQHLVDYIVPGDCGPATGPSNIRRLDDGSILRSQKQ